MARLLLTLALCIGLFATTSPRAQPQKESKATLDFVVTAADGSVPKGLAAALHAGRCNRAHPPGGTSRRRQDPQDPDV